MAGVATVPAAVTLAMTFTMPPVVMAAVLMELLGAIRTFEFVALAGSTGKSEGGEQQEEAFHGGGI